TVADLYEIAAAAYDELWANITPAIGQALGNPNYHEFHLHILLTWGLRLDQLGYGPEATSRLRQADRIAEDWVRALTDPDKIREVLAVRALVLAKLGQIDEAVALAEPVIVPLHDQGLGWAAWGAHFALGVAYRARGELAAAHRELLAARWWTESDS